MCIEAGWLRSTWSPGLGVLFVRPGRGYRSGVASSARSTSRNYAHPGRPWVRRLYDALAPGGLRGVTVPRLVDEARRATGLERFACEVEEPLGVLIDSLREEARLSATGRLITLADMRACLRLDLRAAAWLDRHPEIAETPLPAPVVVTGLPRSGTTLLHRLLGQLPGARFVSTWETLEPVPPLEWRRPADPLADPRVGRGHQASRFLRWLSPDLLVAHPMGALEPEEEALLLAKCFRSGVPETSYHMPSYARWLEQQDPVPAYRWLALMLRFLQWQRAGQSWFLKSPHHLGELDALRTVLPGCTVIQIHRDPVVTVPSFCSLVAHGHGIMSNHIDPHEIGRHWARRLERMLARCMEHRRVQGEHTVIDVLYADLVADPVAVIERLCARLGLPWSDETRARLATWHAEHPRHRDGRHRYGARDFGLEPGELAERFGAYRQRFGLDESEADA